MRVGIHNKGILDLSVVRGVGSYVTMMLEAIGQYGERYDLKLDQSNYDVLVHPGFFPFVTPELNKKKKNAVVIHDLIPIKYPQFFPAGWRGIWKWFKNSQALLGSDAFITDSHVVQAEIARRLSVPIANIDVVYPAAKKVFYSPKKLKENLIQRAALPAKYALYVGDVTWNKNLETLARAVQEANITLVLVGKALAQRDTISHPWQRSFRKFLSLTEGDKRFIFLGYVPDEQVVSLYQHAVFTILPSYDEGFGLPWLEAALSGSPVIVSKIPVIEEITQGVSVYCDQTDVHAMAQTMGEMYFNRVEVDLSAQLKQAKKFSQEAFVKSLAHCLHKL
ncbi:MAG: glycosyltransferase family 1 protein [Patescibacteria group bacterium]|jgi:glycosyltransferase involved in cell wall biosynthesis